ncbi:DUF3347 domain-containing protein [Pontibacter sp. 172403-2]|uniref:DUF3347 domain-containing protein n=1 Tax=Pontibacter rufus TaxID=2791028 RepID=UPI0018AF9BF7|nr:DUF3347 domain-containing protein [Pontibacter sp. 172403-2]MBF9252202.1 DUF3347 domain-containing protein [Pontibacter sp. 172403-2]
MKNSINSIVSVAIAAIALTACNGGNNNAEESNAASTAVTQTEQQANSAETVAATPINGVVDDYLQLKNALAADNGQEAASAGNELMDALKELGASSLTPEQKQVYDEVQEDAIEHAEHIGMNADNIEHQREHFDIISQDMYDLVKAFDGVQKLYVDYCPMYNDNKGATWLSATEEISNPYLGSAMPTCGEVKEEIN